MFQSKVVVVCKFPARSEQSDGMMIRVVEVDRVLSEVCDPLYLDIHPRHLRYKAEDVEGRKVIRLHPLIHILKLRKIIRDSSVLYIHSLINFLKVFPHVMTSHTRYVLDVHGAVVEEMAASRPSFRWLLAGIERIAFRMSDRIIVVSDAMMSFYIDKYHLKADKFLRVPLFGPQVKSSDALQDRSGAISVIYAGGDQPWQNMQLMIKTVVVEVLHDLRFRFFLHPRLVQKYQEGASDSIEFSTASADQIMRYYRESDMGFLLRDDSLVNRVATPTKFIEYVANGVVPIIIQPNIGDLLKYDYKYIKYHEFIEGGVLSRSQLVEMRKHNYDAYIRQRGDAEEHGVRLKEYVRRALIGGLKT